MKPSLLSLDIVSFLWHKGMIDSRLVIKIATERLSLDLVLDPAELELAMKLSDEADKADDLLRELDATRDPPTELANRIYLYCAVSALWDEWSTIGHPELELESLIEDHEPAPWYDSVRLYAPLPGAKRSPQAHEERISRVLASERAILERN